MENREQRAVLRKELRKKRQALSPQEQNSASIALQKQCDELSQGHANLALYLSNDGEISPQFAIESLWQQHKNVYLPVMHPLRKGYLNFQQYRQDSALPANKYGIPEPNANALETIPIKDLSIIFMPLVGFDAKGNRLGMGGGYYDRTLNSLNRLSSRPMLIGLAHDCQQVDELPVQSWDIPLDMIVTATQKIIIKGNG